MKMTRWAAALALVGAAACSDPDSPAADTETNATMATGNALLEQWQTPFGVPPFDRIRSDDYLPAIRAGMAEQNIEIDGIVSNTDAPTFANTVEALERSGRTLRKVNRVFNALNSAHTDEVIKATARVIAPELSAHRDNIRLNTALFERIVTVYERRAELGLNGEQQQLLEETYKDFIRSGARLGAASQQRLRAINAEIAQLSQQFQEHVLNETNEFELLVSNRADLGQLPASLVALAADEARRRGHACECWVFTLQRPSIEPFLQYSPNRDLRRQIYEAYAMRGDNDDDNDNKDIVSRMVSLRAERAALLGFESHADFVLADNMAKTPENVYALLRQIWEPALRRAREELADLQVMMDADGIDGKVRGWDWSYYSEKVREARFDIDEEALRPYFEVNAVRDGAFALASRLFGIRFERRDDLPRWHPDQQVFEVTEADGHHLAILYMDFFARDSKRGGAWMNSLRPQSGLDGFITPVVTNNFNFPAPTAQSPSLLSLSEAETLFHEFGHALHGMFSAVTYESLAGTATPRDFVELPSQVMENWVRTPELLDLFARHYETGESIPQDIVEKIQTSARFNQGFIKVEYLAAAYLDMAYHSRHSIAAVEPRTFEREAMAAIGLIDEIIPRYRSGYFQHIFSGGYSAGYYSYIWSEVLDADTFMAFREAGLFDRDLASAYRENILSKGGTRPGMDLYRNFLGREPEVGPLLEKLGLN